MQQSGAVQHERRGGRWLCPEDRFSPSACLVSCSPVHPTRIQSSALPYATEPLSAVPSGGTASCQSLLNLRFPLWTFSLSPGLRSGSSREPTFSAPHHSGAAWPTHPTSCLGFRQVSFQLWSHQPHFHLLVTPNPSAFRDCVSQ